MAKDTAIQTVKMEDGSIRDFPGKRRVQKETVIAANGSILTTVYFINGSIRQFTPPASLITRFAAHGIDQKLGDSYAGLEAIEDCVLAVDELLDALNQGKWSVGREGGGSSMAGASVLLEALALRMAALGKNTTTVQLREYLANKTQAEKISMRNTDALRPYIQKVEEARHAQKIAKGKVPDADRLLAELDDEISAGQALQNALFAPAAHSGADVDEADGQTV